MCTFSMYIVHCTLYICKARSYSYLVPTAVSHDVSIIKGNLTFSDG